MTEELQDYLRLEGHRVMHLLIDVTALEGLGKYNLLTKQELFTQKKNNHKYSICGRISYVSWYIFHNGLLVFIFI